MHVFTEYAYRFSVALNVTRVYATSLATPNIARTFLPLQNSDFRSRVSITQDSDITSHKGFLGVMKVSM